MVAARTRWVRWSRVIGAYKDVVLWTVSEVVQTEVDWFIIVAIINVVAILLKPVEGLLRTIRAIRIIPGEIIRRFWATATCLR